MTVWEGVHSPLPETPGENEVATALLRAMRQDWHLWFKLQQGSMSEVDALVLAPDLGCFCIEVKNYHPELIEEYGEDELVTPRGPEPHPLQQAQEAVYGLLRHLKTRGLEDAQRPFFYSTVAFPQIRRELMYEAFGSAYAQHFDGMVFGEDLLRADSLRDRLLAIARRRPRGRNYGHLRPSAQQVDAVLAKLTRRTTKRSRPFPNQVIREFNSDLETLVEDAARSASKPLRAEQRRRSLHQPGVSRRNGVSRVVLHGKPGTGKTTELLQVALAHAMAGRRSLLCCYNKVLAADLRSRIAELASFGGALQRVTVTHFGALPEGVVSAFDTVCVDEAQDVSEEEFARLAELAGPGAEWFLSDSPGQALYQGRARFLENAVATARTNGTWETLRFNRRSGVAERLIADAALECSPNVAVIPGWVADHPIKVPASKADRAQEILDLGIPSEPRGHLPELNWLPSNNYRDRVGFWTTLIDAEMGQVRAGDDLDLAIVTVRRRDGELSRVKHALEMLGLPYLDQVEPSRRDHALVRGTVRIVTIHSMRGVDSSRVLLLGLEQLESMPENQNALLNIALSRGRHGMRIVLRPTDAQPGSHRAFVEALVTAYRDSLVSSSAE